MYRRGVASDAQPSSRPLPLCGIAQGAVCATRLDAPPLVLPRGAAGVGWRTPVGRDDSARRPPAPFAPFGICKGGACPLPPGLYCAV